MMFNKMLSEENSFPFQSVTDTAPRSQTAKDGHQYWDMLAESVILILGAPRSGTTWLAKIIDSHPDILYRHEPDELTAPITPGRPLEQVSLWLRQRAPRASAKRPLFAKSFRPAPLAVVRDAMLAAMAVAHRLPVAAKMFQGVGVPDLVAGSRRNAVRAAVKVVNWDGSRAAAMLPATRTVFILRHPCGQVASALAGWASGRFDGSASGEGRAPSLAAAETYAAAHGVARPEFQALADAAKLAWAWRAFNEPAIERLDRLPNVKVVIYETLCKQPEFVSRELLEFCGLDWHPQTARFLANSTASDRSSGFYDVFRITAVVADRWRQTLGRPDQDAVRAVVRASPLARYWADLAAEHPPSLFMPT